MSHCRSCRTDPCRFTHPPAGHPERDVSADVRSGEDIPTLTADAIRDAVRRTIEADPGPPGFVLHPLDAALVNDELGRPHDTPITYGDLVRADARASDRATPAQRRAALEETLRIHAAVWGGHPW